MLREVQTNALHIGLFTFRIKLPKTWLSKVSIFTRSQLIHLLPKTTPAMHMEK